MIFFKDFFGGGVGQQKSRGSTPYKVEPLSFLYGVEPTLRGCFCLRSCNLQLRRTAGIPSNQSATSSY